MARLKVVSLNLWHGGRLFDEIVAFLRDEDPDVVMLQEVYGGTDPNLERRLRSVSALRAELDYPYWHFAPAFKQIMDEGEIDQGNAVLTRLPIVKREAMPYGPPYRALRDEPKEWPTEPRVIQWVGLETSVGEVNIMNFHGAWDLDGDNFGESRRVMSMALLSAIKGKRNVILGGDTNARATNPALRALETPLRPVFDPPPTSTFNMRHKDNPGYATSAVDLMYVSPEIQVLERECPDVDISDHRPIVVTLEIKGDG